MLFSLKDANTVPEFLFFFKILIIFWGFCRQSPNTQLPPLITRILKMVGFGPADVPPSAAVKFVGAGTAACIADLLTFPLDTAKVRLQVKKNKLKCKYIFIYCMYAHSIFFYIFFDIKIQGEAAASASIGRVPASMYRGVFGTIITMVRTEGPLSLYSGLVAGLQRQMSFASVRIGLYDSVKQFYTRGSDRRYLFYKIVQSFVALFDSNPLLCRRC